MIGIRAGRTLAMYTAELRRQAASPSASTDDIPCDAVVAAPSVAFGTSGAVACRLGLGTHSLHRLFSHRARQNYLQLAFDLGVRHFDTAPSYGAGLAERELGCFARGRRSAVQLVSKFGIAPSAWATVVPGGAYWAGAARMALRATGMHRAPREGPPRDYSASAMRRSVEASLRRLRTDFLDVLFLHAPQPDCLDGVEALMSALETLREAGSVRRIGLSGAARPCEQIARRYPALAQVLQIEVPADSDGLPRTTPACPQAAIGFWECANRPSGSDQRAVSTMLERLQQAVPAGLILLSTREERVLRQAVAHLSHRGRADPGRSASDDPRASRYQYP